MIWTTSDLSLTITGLVLHLILVCERGKVDKTEFFKEKNPTIGIYVCMYDKIGCISLGQGHLRSNSQTRCPHHWRLFGQIGNSPPQLWGIMTQNSLGSCSLVGWAMKLKKHLLGGVVTFSLTWCFEGLFTEQDLVLSYCSNNQNRLEEKCKSDFLNLKWPFRWILSNWAQILYCTQGPPNICVCKISYIGISAQLRALGLGQRFDNTFWILLLRRRI